MNLGLSDHDMATSHAFQVMIEEQLIPCLHLDRYVYNTWNEYSKLGLHSYQNPFKNYLTKNT